MRVVYLADRDTAGVGDLYSVPIGGGAIVKLTLPFPDGGDAEPGFLVSPDSTRVVYSADQNTDDRFELFSVPIGGGAVAKLNATIFPPGGDVELGFSVSLDGTRAFYRADQDTDDVVELYAAILVTDRDDDGIWSLCDLCPADPDPGQEDSDTDGDGDACDICPTFYNPDGVSQLKLNGPLVSGGDVANLTGSPLISPDGARVVYLADQDTDDVFELYSAPAGGGVVTKLNDPPVAGGGVGSFLISPNSARVIYRADQDMNDVFELYSVPIGGGAATKLHPALPAGRGVSQFSISPNSSRVVYRADQDTNDVLELYSVPIGGGAAAKLHPALPAGRSAASFRISPNSTKVVFVADLDTDDVFELYSVPIGGGTVTKLNDTLPPAGDVGSPLAISPNSARAIYLADRDTDQVFELYSVPIGGGAVTKLNTALTAGRTATNFLISPNSARVIYRADQDMNDVFELYSVPTGGGAVTKLNTPLPGGGDVHIAFISPNSNRVLYVADQVTDDLLELYSVPIGGGAVTRLNEPLPAGGDVSNLLASIQFSPGGASVVYQADQDTDDRDELYRVPIGGGAVAKVNGPLPAYGDVVSFLITPDGSSVVYRVSHGPSSFELYSVPLSGGAATRVNPADRAGRFILSHSISPDGTRAVYLADQDTAFSFELYSAVLFTDSDGDGVQSLCDICPVDPDPGQEDFDADTLGDACDPDDDNDSFLDPADCLDTDATVWALPSEARNLVFASNSRTLNWTAPSDLGGTSVVYDTIRSSRPSDFVGFGMCLETGGANRSSVDAAVPALGELFSYLIRAENACGLGSLGTDSGGAPRQGLNCP